MTERSPTSLGALLIGLAVGAAGCETISQDLSDLAKSIIGIFTSEKLK